MKKIVKISLFSFIGLVVVVCILIFRPINNPRMSDCSLLQGKLIKVQGDSQTKDLYLRLEGVNKHLYINRGLEQGLTEDHFKSLIGQNISVYVVNHWTLLDPKGKVKHVSQVEHDGEVLFTEFD